MPQPARIFMRNSILLPASFLMDFLHTEGTELEVIYRPVVK
jgi:hypothetical protein